MVVRNKKTVKPYIFSLFLLSAIGIFLLYITATALVKLCFTNDFVNFLT